MGLGVVMPALSGQEIQLQEVQSENARLAEENLQLNEKAEWAGQVKSSIFVRWTVSFCKILLRKTC